VRIFNNLFTSTTALTGSDGNPNTTPFITISFSDPSLTGATDVVVANNTLIGSPGFSIGVFSKDSLNSSTLNNIYILNNIVANGSRDQQSVAFLFDNTGTGITYGSYGDGKVVTVDGNLYWPGTGPNPGIGMAGVYYTYTNFKAACTTPCQNTGVNADSLLTSSGLLTSSSPARAAGINLTSYCTETPAMCLDRAGNARPASGAWDIGAYEYVSGSTDTTPPAAPSGLAVN
jgi:hypothetical protein